MSINKFEEWLTNANPEEGEIETLYYAVRDRESNGIWEVEKIGDDIIIKANHTKLLMIFDKERAGFFDALKNYCNLGDDLEMDIGYQRNMNNPKA